jgi:hypothetical protein
LGGFDAWVQAGFPVESFSNTGEIA